MPVRNEFLLLIFFCLENIVKLKFLFCFAGFAYGNVFDINLDKHVEALLRSFALMVILLLAGLHLDPAAIRKLSLVVFRLAFGPSIVETATLALTGYLFFDLPLAWCLLLGFVIPAASPAVTVPGMIRLQEKRLGTQKGIPTLIMAAGSVDDVLAITGFSVCLGFAFPGTESASLAWTILKGPLEAVVGVAFGLLAGVFLWYFPEQCVSEKVSTDGAATSSSSKFHLHRFVLLLLLATFALFGSQHFAFDGAGPLAIIVLSFVAALRWRPSGFSTFNEDGLKVLWNVLEHFLFCLIGSDVRIKQLQGSVLLYGLLMLLLCIILRTITACLVIYGNNLSVKEKLYTAIAWLPKATVQAAIGSVALDYALVNGSEEDIARGRLVLTIAVLSILLTAPFGAVAIDVCSKFLLTYDKTEENGDDGLRSSVEVALEMELEAKE